MLKAPGHSFSPPRRYLFPLWCTPTHHCGYPYCGCAIVPHCIALLLPPTAPIAYHPALSEHAVVARAWQRQKRCGASSARRGGGGGGSSLVERQRGGCGGGGGSLVAARWRRRGGGGSLAAGAWRWHWQCGGAAGGGRGVSAAAVVVLAWQRIGGGDPASAVAARWRRYSGAATTEAAVSAATALARQRRC
jgi:hypothetical protein